MRNVPAEIEMVDTFDRLEAAMVVREAIKHESFKKSTNAYIDEMSKIIALIEDEIVAICKNVSYLNDEVKK